MTCRRLALAVIALVTAASGATAIAQPAPTAMSSDWAQALCKAWNNDKTLTEQLAASGWAGNHGGRGMKAMQIFRSDCPASARVELHIVLKDGLAQCIHGGAPQDGKLDPASDYLMWADTARWREMGNGDYGPMRAMAFGRLNFSGPKLEAMSNMGPFEGFLLLVGQVPGDWTTCP
ncbi:MAG: SCP2 sterol-binding domain-containing protein [Burkholderiales bacterium]|nr:SCP2 sterol-binding domain-containing protein [Burkholderiales bacterium]